MITVNTPPEILDLMMSEDIVSPTFTREEVRRIAKRDCVTGVLCDSEVFYAPDRECSIFCFDDLRACVCGVIDDVRKVVADVMKENGNIVHMPLNKAIFVPRKGRNGSRFFDWVPKAYDQRFCMKYTPYDSVGEFSAPSHPNLMSERVVSVDLGGSLTIAPNNIGGSTLREAEKDLSKRQRLSVLIDAMKGCSCLHKNGFVHRDVKPGNILVFRENVDGIERVVGKLFDHKLVINDGYSYSGLTRHGTQKFMHVCWHGDINEPRVVRPEADVFAFGISLIDQLYIREFASFSLRRDGRLPSFSIRYLLEDLKWVLIKEPEIYDFISSMLARNPKDSPSLDEVISFFEQIDVDKRPEIR